MRFLFWDRYDDTDANKAIGFERYTFEGYLEHPCVIFDKLKGKYLLGDRNTIDNTCVIVGALTTVDELEAD